MILIFSGALGLRGGEVQACYFEKHDFVLGVEEESLTFCGWF